MDTLKSQIHPASRDGQKPPGRGRAGNNKYQRVLGKRGWSQNATMQVVVLCWHSLPCRGKHLERYRTPLLGILVSIGIPAATLKGSGGFIPSLTLSRRPLDCLGRSMFCCASFVNVFFRHADAAPSIDTLKMLMPREQPRERKIASETNPPWLEETGPRNGLK